MKLNNFTLSGQRGIDTNSYEYSFLREENKIKNIHYLPKLS